MLKLAMGRSGAQKCRDASSQCRSFDDEIFSTADPGHLLSSSHLRCKISLLLAPIDQSRLAAPSLSISMQQRGCLDQYRIRLLWLLNDEGEPTRP